MLWGKKTTESKTAVQEGTEPGSVAGARASLLALAISVRDGEGPLSDWLRQTLKDVPQQPQPDHYLDVDPGRMVQGPAVQLRPLSSGTVWTFACPPSLPLMTAAALLDVLLWNLGVLPDRAPPAQAVVWLRRTIEGNAWGTVGSDMNRFAQLGRQVMSVEGEAGEVCVRRADGAIKRIRPPEDVPLAAAVEAVREVLAHHMKARDG